MQANDRRIQDHALKALENRNKGRRKLNLGAWPQGKGNIQMTMESNLGT